MENNMIGGSGMSWMTQSNDEQRDQMLDDQNGMQDVSEQPSQFQMGVDAIENQAKAAEQANKYKRQQWLCSLVFSAYRNGGMSHKSLGKAATMDLGSPVYGVQRLSGLTGEDAKMNGSYAVMGDVKKPDGSTGIGMVGLVSPETILRAMETIGPGSGNYGLRKQLWSDGGFDKFTPEQTEKMGIRNPDSVQVVGSTTISGSQARRLFGNRFNSRPRTISTFAADGNGGFTNTEYNGETGERSVVNSGTRDPNYKGRWSVIESGPDGETQKNDLTGERIFIPKGSSLRAEMTKASTPDKYGTRNAQMAKNADDNNANKEKDRNLRERKMRLDTLNNMVEEKRKALGDTINEDEKKRIQGQIDELQNFIKMDIGIFGDASGASPSQPDNLVSALESAKARQAGNGATSSSDNDDLANRINQTADHIDAMRERLKNAKTDKERNSVLAEIKKYEEMNKSLSAEYDKKYVKKETKKSAVPKQNTEKSVSTSNNTNVPKTAVEKTAVKTNGGGSNDKSAKTERKQAVEKPKTNDSPVPKSASVETTKSTSVKTSDPEFDKFYEQMRSTREKYGLEVPSVEEARKVFDRIKTMNNASKLISDSFSKAASWVGKKVTDAAKESARKDRERSEAEKKKRELERQLEELRIKSETPMEAAARVLKAGSLFNFP